MNSRHKVSSQSRSASMRPDVSRSFKQRRGFTFTILSDPNTDVIRRYDLLHIGAGPGERDVSRPAEFILDSFGTVRWVNFTDDIRVRARADEMLSVARSIQCANGVH